jgi:hypothetical protein
MGLQGAAASGGGGAGKGVASTGRTGGGAGGITAVPGGKTAAPGAKTLAVRASDAGGGPMQDKGQNGHGDPQAVKADDDELPLPLPPARTFKPPSARSCTQSASPGLPFAPRMPAGNELVDSVFKRTVSLAGSCSQREGLRAGDGAGGSSLDSASAGNELDSVFKRIVSPAGSCSQREGLRAGNGAGGNSLDSASNARPDATILSHIQEQKQLELQSVWLLEQARIQKLKSKGFSGVDLWAYQ